MPPAPVLLLPPSEGKSPGGTGAPWAPVAAPSPSSTPTARRRSPPSLRAMRAAEPARRKLLGVKGDALAAATAANRAVRTGPTMPAIERYTGVLYDALDRGLAPAPATRSAWRSRS